MEKTTGPTVVGGGITFAEGLTGRVLLSVVGVGVVVGITESARGMSAQTDRGSVRVPTVPDKIGEGFVVGATRPVGNGGSGLVAGAGGGIEGIEGSA